MQVESKNVWRVWVPAGKYLIGDPCYAVPDGPREDNAKDMWSEAGESCGWWDASPVATVKVQGKEYNILGFGTAWGDGTYRGSDGFEYSVDAGLIGLVPLEIADTKKYGDQEVNRVIEFDRETLCINNEGDMYFGNLRINTMASDEEVEEEDEEGNSK